MLELSEPDGLARGLHGAWRLPVSGGCFQSLLGLGNLSYPGFRGPLPAAAGQSRSWTPWPAGRGSVPAPGTAFREFLAFLSARLIPAPGGLFPVDAGLAVLARCPRYGWVLLPGWPGSDQCGWFIPVCSGLTGCTLAPGMEPGCVLRCRVASALRRFPVSLETLRTPFLPGRLDALPDHYLLEDESGMGVRQPTLRRPGPAPGSPC